MTKNELIANLEELESFNTIDSYVKAIELIDQFLKDAKMEDVFALEYKRIELNIKLFSLKIDLLGENDYKEEINLRGKLVKLFNQLEKKEPNQEKKYEIRYKGLEALRLHKETIKKYRNNKDSKISIPEKVGLSVLNIAKSMEIFIKEKDLITKAKNVVKDTAAGTMSTAIILGGVGLALQHFAGVPLGLMNFVRAFPVVAYIGLSSLIRNLSSKTPFEQYQYQQSDEYKELVEKFNEDNKELILSIANMVKEKESTTDIESKIAINENLINRIDEIAMKAEIRGVREVFELQALSSLRENQELCEQIIDDYLDENNNDKEKYDLYNAKLKKIKLEIFKRANSVKDAVKDSGKSIVKNTAVMAVAKAVLSCVAPGTFPMNVGNVLIEPFVFATINGLIDIPTYRNKLKFKETEYKGKVKLNNKRRIEEILEIKRKQPVLA